MHKHGLQITPYGGSVQFMENGDYFGSYHDPEAAHREMARHSKSVLKFQDDRPGIKWFNS